MIEKAQLSWEADVQPDRIILTPPKHFPDAPLTFTPEYLEHLAHLWNMTKEKQQEPYEERIAKLEDKIVRLDTILRYLFATKFSSRTNINEFLDGKVDWFY